MFSKYACAEIFQANERIASPVELRENSNTHGDFNFNSFLSTSVIRIFDSVVIYYKYDHRKAKENGRN
jgi:hypothetical protein